MSGILQSSNITVAKTTENEESNINILPDESAFSNGIATIGHSWKLFSGVYIVNLKLGFKTESKNLSLNKPVSFYTFNSILS